MKNAERLADRFAAAVAAHADRSALRIGDRCWDYRELDGELSRLRATLAEVCTDPDRPVAVVVDGTAPTFLPMLAVLFSPHPLIPVDAASPRSRVSTILADTGALLWSADSGTDTMSTADLVPGHPRVDCAVLAFTSGSTGTPKAVRQGDELWLHQATELAHELGIGPGAIVAQALPAAFGGGIDITVTTLLAGALLWTLDPRIDGVGDLVASLRRGRAQSLHLSPALLRAILDTDGAGEALRGIDLVATCGEALDAAEVNRLRALTPEVTFVNRSGSSETGNLAFNSFAPDRELPTGTLPAGRIAAGKHIRVLDEDGTPLPDGAVGAIEVHSPHLARGYLCGGELVDFATHDTGGGQQPAAVPVRSHRTGDVGRVDGDRLTLLGRSDDTVKIRGYRVDIGEVTAAARAADGVGDAVVIAHKSDGRTELVAYVAPPRAARAPAVATVRTAIGRAVPSWMVPAHIVLLPELPRTERGKVDRTALPAPRWRPAYTPPATGTEKLLAAIYADLLGIGAGGIGAGGIGTGDDFVALGGDSLTAVTLLQRVEETFGVSLPPSAPITDPTVRDLAARIDAAAPVSADGVVVHLPGTHEPGATNDPDGMPAHSPIVFAFAGAGESALAFAPLARRLTGHRLIGLHAHGLENRGVPDPTIRRAARRFARQVRRLCPHGPYRFVGHSLGGVIAMEVARILIADGEVVEHIVCLDTVLTGPLQRRLPVHLPASTADTTHAATGSDVVDTEQVAAEHRSTWDLWRTRAALLTAGWWPRPADAQWSLFHELGRRSALLHRLHPWSGPATIVLAEDNPDPGEWWEVIAPEHHGVHRISGDHNGILRAPHVDVTAGIVADALAGAHV
ncbi:AMP-binding protein [Gordonia polyisoprenivorans]|uniref:AMP-binding protein n=1 Tax=Gordonia polyisoprenivorans TaxID=84595 RepID=UPI001AD7B7E8|nr:AMP-binding protein [Gordonia polyisoprenivorans]QTI67090.1 AMP-binding protein [Gordonia polyisoprenivorans]